MQFFLFFQQKEMTVYEEEGKNINYFFNNPIIFYNSFVRARRFR